MRYTVRGNDTHVLPSASRGPHRTLRNRHAGCIAAARFALVRHDPDARFVARELRGAPTAL